MRGRRVGEGGGGARPVDGRSRGEWGRGRHGEWGRERRRRAHGGATAAGPRC